MSSGAQEASETVPDDSGHAGIFRTLRDMPRSVRYALLGVFINAFGMFLQAFMILYMVDYRGFAEWQAGLCLSAYGAGAIMGVLFGGGLTDRLGPRWTIVLAVGSASLMTFSVTLLSRLPAIVVVVALAGAMTMASRPAVTALLFKSVPAARQVMAQAMYRTALSIGAVGGPLAAAWLSTIHWNLVFYVDAASALVYCAIALFLLPRGKIVVDEPAAGSTPAATSKAGYRTMLRDYRYLGYLVLMLANGIVHVQFITTLPLVLKDAGYGPYPYSVALTVSSALIIGCELLITKRTQTWPLWIAILAGWVMLVIGRGMFGLIGLVGGMSVLLVGTVIAVTGQMIGGPAAFAYPAKVAPSAAMGRYIGAAHSLFQMGSAVGAMIGGVLWAVLGRPFWLYIVVFGLAMVGVGIWSMRPTGHGIQRTGPEPEPATVPDVPGAQDVPEPGEPTAAEPVADRT